MPDEPAHLPPPPPPIGLPAKPKTSALAIWSLVLGILGFFSFGLTSVPGLILGIIALVKTGPGLGGRGQAIAGVVLSSVVLLLIPLTMAVALPAYNQMVAQAVQIKSMNNVKQLHIAIQLYTLDNDSYPPDWDTLFEEAELPDVLRYSPLGDGQTEYLLLTPGAEEAQLPPNTPVIRDPNVIQGQSVVGHANGQVRLVPVADLPPLPGR